MLSFKLILVAQAFSLHYCFTRHSLNKNAISIQRTPFSTSLDSKKFPWFNSDNIQKKSSLSNKSFSSLSRPSFFSQIFNYLRNTLAVLSLLLVIPSASFARSSQSKKSSLDVSSPSANVKVITKNKNVPIDLREPSQETVVNNNANLNNQRLQYIGLGLTAVTVIISIISGDDESSSKKTIKRRKSAASTYIPPPRSKPPTTSTASTSSTTVTPKSSASTVVPVKRALPNRLKPTANTINTSSSIPSPVVEPQAPAQVIVPKTTSTSTTNIPPISNKVPTLAELQNRRNIDDDDDLFGDQDEQPKVLTPTTSKSTSDSKPTSTSSVPKRILPKMPRPPLSPPLAATPSPPTPAPPSPPSIPTPPAVITASAPVAKKQDKGILSRLFSKPGGNRNPDLMTVLKTNDDAQEFRTLVATFLVKFVNRPIWSELEPNGEFYDRRADTVQTNPDTNATDNNDEIAKLLAFISNSLDLTVEQAAEAFAEVTSAILVSLIDKTVELHDKKGEENELLDSIDAITNFVEQAGGLYAKNYASIAIEPVQYNGKVKRDKVENLYFLYFKSTSSYQMNEMFNGFNEELTNTDTSSSDTANDDSAKLKKEEESNKVAMRNEKMGLLQRALGIKEGKRNSLEQKVQKELLMNMGGGLGGGGGGFGDLFGKAGAGGGGIPDFMSAGAPGGGGFPGIGGGFPGIGGAGGGPPGDDPFKNMSQEEIADMTKESLKEVSYRLCLIS